MKLHIKTKQTCAVVGLIAALNDLTPELVLCVSKDRVYIRQAIRNNTILISLDIPGERFDAFQFSGDPSEIHLPTSLALQVLHTSAITDTLGFDFDSVEDPHKMNITLAAAVSTRVFSIPAGYAESTPPPALRTRVQYDRALHLHTKQLTYLIHHLFPYSDTFIVEAKSDKLQFRFENGTNSCVSSGCVTIGNANSVQPRYACARYSSDAMTQLAKCFCLHQVCNLLLADDAPLVIETDVNELGALKIALMPI